MKLECAFQDNSHLYFVQSMMEGGDGLFVQNTYKDKKLPLEVARWFTGCCLIGLEDLHEDHQILHRDIKEENLLVDKNGYAKLADFGMADKLNASGISYSHGGTLVYMSPESRDSTTDRAQRKTHDFFAVGVMLFRMLTNKFPFQIAGHDYNTVVSMHLSSRIQIAEEKGSNKALQIEQQDILLGKEDLEKTYELESFMEKNINDKDAIDLIKKLVKFKQEDRIGATDGACEIMQHPFFSSLNFAAMKDHTVKAPYIPNPDARGNICRGDLDIFEQLAFDGAEEERDPVIDKKLNEKFADFYFNPWHEASTRGEGTERSEKAERRRSKLVSSRKALSNKYSSERSVSRRDGGSFVAVERKEGKAPSVPSVKEADEAEADDEV